MTYGYNITGISVNIEMKYLKAIWMFCSYLFWPQRRPKEDAANIDDR